MCGLGSMHGGMVCGLGSMHGGMVLRGLGTHNKTNGQITNTQVSNI